MHWNRLFRPPELTFATDRLIEESVRGRWELPVANVMDVTIEVSSHAPARLSLASIAGNRITIEIGDSTQQLRRDLGAALDATSIYLTDPVRRALELVPNQ